jgi:hypothetical protein
MSGVFVRRFTRSRSSLMAARSFGDGGAAPSSLVLHILTPRVPDDPTPSDRNALNPGLSKQRNSCFSRTLRSLRDAASSAVDF